MDHPERSPAEQEHIGDGGSFNYAGEKGSGHVTYICKSPGTEQVFILSHVRTEPVPSFLNANVKGLQNHSNLGAQTVYDILNDQEPQNVGLSWDWKSKLSQTDGSDEEKQSVDTQTIFRRAGNSDRFMCTTLGDDIYDERLMTGSEIVEEFGLNALPSGDEK
ncbi:uncharacterized protein L203_104252 [Cryptococcus depauperatus CBS 7841]|uniref:Uncharacterized protein n=1 Tax=Cryptococcus depauperatus CBS 7841 TaxID=1295531 RepID=A0A1E3I5R5_9TREE|nr:hypothetical protein L203_05257 [Cryptococcus depauperatus CBS 7841]